MHLLTVLDFGAPLQDPALHVERIFAFSALIRLSQFGFSPTIQLLPGRIGTQNNREMQPGTVVAVLDHRISGGVN